MLSQAVHRSNLPNWVVKAQKRRQDKNTLSGLRNTRARKGRDGALELRDRRKIKLGNAEKNYFNTFDPLSATRTLPCQKVELALLRCSKGSLNTINFPDFLGLFGVFLCFVIIMVIGKDGFVHVHCINLVQLPEETSTVCGVESGVASQQHACLARAISRPKYFICITKIIHRNL